MEGDTYLGKYVPGAFSAVYNISGQTEYFQCTTLYGVSRGDGEKDHDCAWSFERKSWSFHPALVYSVSPSFPIPPKRDVEYTMRPCFPKTALVSKYTNVSYAESVTAPTFPSRNFPGLGLGVVRSELVGCFGKRKISTYQQKKQEYAEGFIY
ncbi:hypothetical protein PCH_Pc13g04850 [Penicillium rubens Wisconsin 54-1255]|uniref:Uncharacterized protein n=1 Tax=Penicillium rubens (strain ATCC 28089 / DSM 1075 / NRRL 1951 / Wisconsin 54-1255) TaxID=500485 RepID=B6H2B9_PENRW|nr:hypothetical protein PCH_Pc13g04850 [Penicillium rubens Wisconsin 54-1255]